MSKEELSAGPVPDALMQFAAAQIGRLAAPGPMGEIQVECCGSTKAARLVSGINRGELSRAQNRGRDVLLIFEAGDPGRPIIVGLMEDPIDSLVAMESSRQSHAEPREILLDGKRITIEAEEEVVLKCGTGSITLRKDGKIVIKGTHLLSRSSGPNRIKGGSVNIN
jgi:hypothetical protein